MTTPELRRELRELIEALDRRLPSVERLGEAAIARDAAALRTRAIARLAELPDDPARPSPSGGELLDG